MSDPIYLSRRDQLASKISSVWWLILVRGIVLIILGAYALTRPGMTMVVFTQVLGVFMIIDGILAVLSGIAGWTESRGGTIMRGVLGILVGIFVLGYSAVVAGVAIVVLMTILAIGSIAGGILEIIVAIRERKEIQGEGWMIVGGL